MSTDPELTDQDVQDDLMDGLAPFPRVRSWLPADFPGDAGYELTPAKLQQYATDRTKAFWHQLNLPLAVHNLRYNADPDNRSLMHSILQTLEDFIARLGHLPGARSELAPLWTDMWTQRAPRLWSIVGCAYVSLCYQTADIDVLGFGALIGGGPKDADINVRLAGRETYVEVEAWHRADLTGMTDEEALSDLEARALRKAGQKFGNLPADHVGVIAEICVVRGPDMERRVQERVSQLPGAPSNVGWTTWKLVGIRHPEGHRFSIVPM